MSKGTGEQNKDLIKNLLSGQLLCESWGRLPRDTLGNSTEHTAETQLSYLT